MTEVEIRLAEFFTEQTKNTQTYFGYPEIPQNNDLSILGISGLAKLHLNNAGDPYVHGNAKMHTKEFEKEVLAFTAGLYDIDPYWGYITSGGTEGNLYGMYTARDYLKSKDHTPYLLYAASSHYSIPKNAHLLGVDQIMVKSEASGELNYQDLKKSIHQIISTREDYGLIINLNIGTTMTGAMDKLSEIYSVIDQLGVPPDRFYIHADAALMGFIYPFLACKENLFEMGVNSIAISGHKFPGTIHPCGIILVKETIHNKAFKKSSWIPYLEVNDTTISGSRNGFLALNLWYIIQTKGREGFRIEAEKCIENATYLYESLKSINYPGVAYNHDQIIVTFNKPSTEIVKKYQLATEGSQAHVVVMQHIDKHKIDQFCKLLALSLKE